MNAQARHACSPVPLLPLALMHTGASPRSINTQCQPPNQAPEHVTKAISRATTRWVSCCITASSSHLALQTAPRPAPPFPVLSPTNATTRNATRSSSHLRVCDSQEVTGVKVLRVNGSGVEVQRLRAHRCSKLAAQLLQPRRVCGSLLLIQKPAHPVALLLEPGGKGESGAQGCGGEV